MFCIHCGTELPDTAAFCRKCGRAVQEPIENPLSIPLEEVDEKGIICCVEVKEKFGIFPKDQLEFRAMVNRSGKDECVAVSPLFNAGVGDLYQSNKKNRRHVAALDSLIDDLRDSGWQVTPATGTGKAWYNRTITRGRK